MRASVMMAAASVTLLAGCGGEDWHTESQPVSGTITELEYEEATWETECEIDPYSGRPDCAPELVPECYVVVWVDEVGEEWWECVEKQDWEVLRVDDPYTGYPDW